MRRLSPGEPQIGGVTATTAGWFCEQGYYCVDAVQADPLLAGLPNPFTVRESHYCEIKVLPAEFEVIATNANCPIQAMKHRSRPLYSTQFHPESWEEEYPHGRQILLNFFRLAGLPC